MITGQKRGITLYDNKTEKAAGDGAKLSKA